MPTPPAIVTYFSDYDHFLKAKKDHIVTSDQLHIIFNCALFKNGKIRIYQKRQNNKGKTFKLFLQCCLGEGDTRCTKCAKKRDVGFDNMLQSNVLQRFMEDHQIHVSTADIEKIICENCKQPDVATEMVLCEGCSKGYHVTCLVPPLEDVPENDWYCPHCSKDSDLIMKEIPYKKLEKIIDTVVDQKLAGMKRSLYELEHKLTVMSKTKYQKNAYIPSTGGARCKSCGCSKKKDGTRLQYQFLDLTFFKRSGIRSISCSDIIGDINKNLICTTCKVSISHKNPHFRVFDTSNKYSLCMICRTQRSSKASQTCSNCDVTRLQREHATYKGPIHKLFSIMKHMCEDIKDVETSMDMDPNFENQHEYPVGEYGKIDFLVKITDVKDNIYMFAIEIMATKVENVQLFTHKVLCAISNIKPYKSFLITLDINDNDNNSGYSITHKLEILRRWVLFAIRYESYLPSINLWWMFSGRRKAFTVMDDSHAFLKNPVELSHAPEGQKDWEFATDPYVMLDKESNPYQPINQKQISINSMFQDDLFVPGNYERYRFYNIDKSKQNIYCTNNCETCNSLIIQQTQM